MARTGDPEGSPHTPAPSLGLRCLSEETPCRPPNEAGRAETGQLAFSETTQTDGDMPPCTGGGRDALCASGMRNHLEEGGTGCREQTGGVCSTPNVENSERSDCWEGRNGEKKTGELAGEKLMGGERPGGDREQAGLFRAGAKEAEDVVMEEQPRAPLTGGEGEPVDVEGTSCSPSGCFTSPTGEPETLSPSVPSSLFGASAGDPGVSSTALGPTAGSQFSPSTLCSPPEKPDDDAGVEEGTDLLPFFDATQATDPGRSPTDTNLDLTAASVSTSSEASFAPTSFSEFSAVASASTAPNGAFADACVPAASSFESSSAVSASLQSPESSPHSESPRQSSSPALAFPASHARPLSRAAARAGVNMSDALPPGLRPDILLHSPPEVVRQYVSEHFAYFQFSKKPETEILAGDKLQEEDSSEESEEEDEKAEGEKAIGEKGEGEKQEGVDSKREEESRRVGGDDMGANAGFDGEKKRRGIEGSEEGEMEVATHADLSGTEFGEAAAVREEEKVSKRREMAMKAKQSARGHSIHRNEDKKKKRRKAEEEETPRLHPVNSLNLSCRRVKLYEVDEMKMFGSLKPLVLQNIVPFYFQTFLHSPLPTGLLQGRWIDKGTGHFYVTEGRGTAAAGDGGGREDERSSLYLERGLERDDEAGEGQRDEDDETGMARLIVEDEENGKVYVDTAIGSNYAYQHQKDSIITWQEGRTGDVYRALSFQHPHGCFACWTYMTLKAPDRCAGGTEEEEEEEGDEGTLGAAEEEQRECGRRQGALGRFRRSTEEGVEDERDDEEEEDEAGVDSLVGLDGAESIPHHILETPNEDNLHMLMTRMEFDLPHPQTGELVLLDVLGRHWLYLLFAFMRKCIAAEKIEQLKQIAFIIRKMLVFWSGHIDALEVLLSDEFWPDVLKSLEYDQDLLHQGMEMRHSEFFAHKAQFHNVIQLEDPVFTSHVHLHYRLMYLKDVAITRYLDEAAINRLQSVLACNIQEVLRLLLRDCQSPPGCPSSPSSFSSYSSHSLVGVQSNESLSSSCFAVLRERLSEDFMAALFLRELLQNLSKLLQQQMLEKHSIFTQIKQHMILLELRGYLDGTSAAVANWNQVFLPLNKKAEEYQERLKEILLADGAETYRPNPLDLSGLPYPTPVCVAVEILNTFAELQPQLLRQAFFSEAKSDAKQESRLLLLLAETLEKSHSDSVQVQVKEILVKVVCSPVMELPEKDEIHMLFYDKGVMDRLLQTLFLPLNADEMTPSDFHRLHHAKQQILEILAHCVPAHKHRFKIRIQKDRVPIRAILASLRPTFDKFLALFAVKFIRACISLKDAYVDKHLVQHKVLRPIIWMLKEEQYAVSLFSSRRQQSSLLASVILDCLRALAAGAATFAAPQAPCHSLHLIEFLFTDDFCRHWIGDIQESMRTTGRRPCQTLQDLHDLYIQFVAKPSLCASQPLHLRSPQDYLSPSSRVLSPRSGGSGARDFFFSGSGLNSSDAGDGNLSPHSLRSSLGRVIRRDPN
ncbi:component of IIS longevity pathway protein SMK-1, partial [Toxoplasma gondii RUB]